MIVKKHMTPDKKLILAVCDQEILGKVIEEGPKQLNLASSFYRGEAMQKEAVKSLMQSAYIVNCVGTESVACALEANVVSEDNVCRISAVPYTQAILLHDE
jgi:uncharacterized protein